MVDQLRLITLTLVPLLKTDSRVVLQAENTFAIGGVEYYDVVAVIALVTLVAIP